MGKWVRMTEPTPYTEPDIVDYIEYTAETVHYTYEPDQIDIMMKLIDKGYVPEGFVKMNKEEIKQMFPPPPPPPPKRQTEINFSIAPMDWCDRLMLLFGIGVLIYFILTLVG